MHTVDSEREKKDESAVLKVKGCVFGVGGKDGCTVSINTTGPSLTAVNTKQRSASQTRAAQ